MVRVPKAAPLAQATLRGTMYLVGTIIIVQGPWSPLAVRW